jgi:hypothetical protein
MQDIQVTEYLTWEYCHDPKIQYLNCPAPSPMHNHMPQWFKNLKAHKTEVSFAKQQTIRNCLGFRGLTNIGYTIPLPETLTGYDTYFSRGRLHPEMIYGTKFANKPGGPWTEVDGSIDLSPYEYRFKILHWPWRARMAPGWRLLILPYLLDWNDEWNEFSGAVEANYDIEDGTGIGSGLKWTQPIDLQFNYYNLETVIAYKRTTTVEKETLIFCAVPLYDPSSL